MNEIKFTVEEREEYVIINIEFEGIINPQILKTIRPPHLVEKNLGHKGVVLNGRAPIWLYGFLIHYYHPSKFVAVYDPRLNGAVIVETHAPEYSAGNVIKV